jgi:hypothetical protein
MNIDTLVESFYSKKDETESIINEVLSLFLENEKPIGSLLVEQKGLTLTWDGVPDIPIVEIPWSDVKTVEGGADIQGPQRKQLMQFLDDIQGEDLKDKIEGIAKFYEADVSQLIAASKDMSPKKQISYALGYLTFFKTLTKIIAHFNASSAGFSFEAFLGVLLGGTQVPTGEGTIADLVAGDGTPVSLKLYTAGALKVGGSFTDLVNDLRKFGKMQYVAVTKTLNDENTAGRLDFYRFNFTLDNVANIMYNGGLENPNLMKLPQGFIDSPEGFADVEIPAPPKIEELQELFMQTVKELADEAGVSAEELKLSLEATDLPQSTSPYLSTTGTKVFGHPRSKLKTKGVAVPFAKAMGVVPDDYDFKVVPPARTPEKAEYNRLVRQAKEITQRVYGGVLVPAYAKITETAMRTIRARQELMSRAGGAYNDAEDPREAAEESVAAYNRLTTEQKKQALLLTHGYVNTDQFELTEPRIMDIKALAAPYEVFPPGQKNVMLGSIQVGQEQVVELMNTVSQIIDTSVFEIFQDLKTLTTNIQAYFGNGLEDDKQATAAIDASKSIGEKTAKLADQDEPEQLGLPGIG